MAEKAIPIPVIEAQVGHTKLLKDYVHIRRHALNAAAEALEPWWMRQQQPTDTKPDTVN